MFSTIQTISFSGVSTGLVEVQVHISSGQPSLSIVGLANRSVTESKDRIRSAILSLGLSLPPKRITVNLSPANVIKDGTHYDLPIALGILTCLNVISAECVENSIVIGELSLNGSINYVPGAILAGVAAIEKGYSVICPESCSDEVSCVNSNYSSIIAAPTLFSLINHLTKKDFLEHPKPINPIFNEPESYNAIDLADVKGQKIAKRALEIAASGGHNIIMIGLPGTGKSMLAKRITTILPELTYEEILEVSMISSIAGTLRGKPITKTIPFRNPHHSSSVASIVGGGKSAKPGEISLAHNGVLFMDEFGEFPPAILDSLRQPMETGEISIARAESHITYPANFQLIAAMNPCKCGYLWDKQRACSKAPICGDEYLRKISGPIMERIDIQIHLKNTSMDIISGPSDENEERSCDVLKRVKKVREIQQQRFTNFKSIKLNKEMSGDAIEKFCNLDIESKDLLVSASKKFNFSMREFHKILRVARTIADMAESQNILKEHLLEAISYRV